MRRRALPSLPLILFLCCDLGCGRDRPVTATAKPSRVEAGQVILRAEAEARLGITLAAVETRALAERRLHAGEVMPMPGQGAMLAAPQAGTVVAMEAGALPAPGTRVRAGQPLLALSPLFGGGERAQVTTVLADLESQVARAEAQAQAAGLALSRSQRLVQEGLAGQKLLEEAQVQNTTAQAALKTARTQQQTLGQSGRQSLLGALRVVSPIDGMVRDLRVAPHQQVQVGAPLIEVVSRDRLWLRVPIASSEVGEIDATREALVQELGNRQAGAAITASPISPPPETAQSLTGTVDLYFALLEHDRFRLGQRVACFIAYKSSTDVVTIPASALIYSASGDTWVYENVAPQTYTRRPIELLRIEGEQAVLRPTIANMNGLKRGAKVAATGAMELYGAELGVAK